MDRPNNPLINPNPEKLTDVLTHVGAQGIKGLKSYTLRNTRNETEARPVFDMHTSEGVAEVTDCLNAVGYVGVAEFTFPMGASDKKSTISMQLMGRQQPACAEEVEASIALSG